MLQVDDGATRTENVTGLDKYTEYEFQVLAFSSGGNGPKSSVKVERTDGELIQYIKITLLSLPRYPRGIPLYMYYQPVSRTTPIVKYNSVISTVVVLDAVCSSKP